MSGHDVFLLVVTTLNIIISAFNVRNIVVSRRSIRRMEQQRGNTRMRKHDDGSIEFESVLSADHPTATWKW